MNEGLGRVLFIAYDLDRFAELIKDDRFSKFHDVDEKMLAMAGDDTERAA